MSRNIAGFILFTLSCSHQYKARAQSADWQLYNPAAGAATTNPFLVLPPLLKPLESIDLDKELDPASRSGIDLAAASLQLQETATEIAKKLLVTRVNLKHALQGNNVVIFHLVSWVPGNDGIGPTFTIRYQHWYALTKSGLETLVPFGPGGRGSDMLYDNNSISFVALHGGLPKVFLDKLAYDFTLSRSVSQVTRERVHTSSSEIPVETEDQAIIPAAWTGRAIPPYSSQPVLAIQLRHVLSLEPETSVWPVLGRMEIYRRATSNGRDLQLGIPLKPLSQVRVNAAAEERKETVFRPTIAYSIPLGIRREGIASKSVFVGLPLESQILKKPIVGLLLWDILAVGIAFRPRYTNDSGRVHSSYSCQLYLALHLGGSGLQFKADTKNRSSTAAQ